MLPEALACTVEIGMMVWAVECVEFCGSNNDEELCVLG